MQQLKVLIFNPKITAGGITKITADYIENFDNNINCDVMTLHVDNDMYFKNKKNKVYQIGLSKNIFKRMKKEYKIMKDNQYDVIHINGDFVSRLVECYIAKKCKIHKIIIHSHSTGVGSNSVIRRILQKVLKGLYNHYATDYLACSNEAAKWMFSKKIIKNNRCHIVRNGIETIKFKFDEDTRNLIRKNNGLSDKYVIGLVGRLELVKNPLFAIELLKEGKKTISNLYIIVIGNGSYIDKMKKKVAEYELSDSVLFLGNIENVNDYYNAMDCYILPSYYEGFPIVGVEAQANGLKTLFSDNITRDVKINDNVKFLSLNDISKWIEEINVDSLFDRKTAYKNIIDKNMDIKSIAKEIQDIYKL